MTLANYAAADYRATRLDEAERQWGFDLIP